MRGFLEGGLGILGSQHFVFKTMMASAILMFLAPNAEASAPTCNLYSGQGYCDYNGRVTQVYINSANQILLYFDTAMPPAAPAAVGITGISNYSAAIYTLTDNVEFGRALYASLLAAQARGSTIAVQLWGVAAGYAKIDRIWVYE
jgi:hypothetical protein